MVYTHVAADWADIADTPTKQEKTSQVMYETMVPRGNETLRRTLGERLQQCHALNQMCNQYKQWGRHHGRVT